MITEVQTTTVQTPDGRELCVEIGGDPSGRPILVHNGTPNSRHLYSRWIEDAERRGVKLVSYDRPGYGQSTPQPGHSVADGAADVRAVAEAMQADRIGVWGCSGGGPYALACAALLPDLVAAVGVIASIAPWGAPGLDFFAGMGQDNVDDVELFFSDREAARRKAAKEREELMSVTADQVSKGWESLVSEADAAVLTGDFAASIVRDFQDGLAPGDQGWWDDGVAHLSPWGFELDSVRVPVKLWHEVHEWLLSHF
jgi:pimeloyl-ACP methyl ester carboxylesterase